MEGPDRRFNNNRELPVLLYGEVTFRSASGLNELIECSRSTAAETFVNTIMEWQRTGFHPIVPTQGKPLATPQEGWYLTVDVPEGAAKQRAAELLREVEPGITDAEVANCLGGGHVPVGRQLSLEQANALMLRFASAGIVARKYRMR